MLTTLVEKTLLLYVYLPTALELRVQFNVLMDSAFLEHQLSSNALF